MHFRTTTDYGTRFRVHAYDPDTGRTLCGRDTTPADTDGAGDDLTAVTCVRCTAALERLGEPAEPEPEPQPEPEPAAAAQIPLTDAQHDALVWLHTDGVLRSGNRHGVSLNTVRVLADMHLARLSFTAKEGRRVWSAKPVT